MVSTSSSECDCTGTFGFGTTFPNIIGNNFCSTTRQPLIYYAKIPEIFHQQPNMGNNKNNSNYFMKAFRWYTQEHGSGHDHEISGSKVKNGDFAAWLDQKYSEYLKGSQQETSNLSLMQSTMLNKDRISKKKSTKRFGRMHSPWRKRRPNSEEKGDILHKIESLEYILPPKELNKLASGCCQSKPRIKSTTTIISKESPKITEIKLKSKSILSTCEAQRMRENNEARTKSHPKNVLCECLKKDTETQYETLSLETLNTPRNKKRISGVEETSTITKRYSPQRFSLPNASCQCSEVNLYEADVARSLRKSHPRQDGNISDEQELSTKKQTLTNQGDSSRMPRIAVMFTDNTTTNVSQLHNLSAQTSDHSINLENVVIEQPVLLKVIHVNK